MMSGIPPLPGSIFRSLVIAPDRVNSSPLMVAGLMRLPLRVLKVTSMYLRPLISATEIASPLLGPDSCATGPAGGSVPSGRGPTRVKYSDELKLVTGVVLRLAKLEAMKRTAISPELGIEPLIV